MAPGFFRKLIDGAKKVWDKTKEIVQKVTKVTDPIVKTLQPAITTIAPQTKTAFDVYNTISNVTKGGGEGSLLPPYYSGGGGDGNCAYLGPPPRVSAAPSYRRKNTGTEFLAPIMSKMYRA